ncbi:MAG TPA: DUF4190 domain-containing protein [Candidatus Saccharimonadales bacterium]
MDPNSQQPFNNTPQEIPQPLVTDQSTPQSGQLAQSQQQAPIGEDPGKSLAIAGIVLAFFMQLVGLILSIVAKKKSKAAGFDGRLATIGIILNIVLLVLSLLITITILSLIFLTTAKTIQERSKTGEAQSAAITVVKKAELYYTEKNTYPTSLADFETVEDASLDKYKASISGSPITSVSDKVAVYTCGSDGIKTEYWDSVSDQATARYAGFASALSSCTQMQ